MTFTPQVPDHTMLRRIGGGSYGEVWLARNVIGTYRAVKVVCRQAFEHDRPYDREFEGIQKFEPISRRHESQVDVLHVGRNDEEGYFYYVDGTDASNWQIRTFFPCQTNVFTIKITNGTCRIQRNPRPGCEDGRLRLAPLSATNAFSHVRISIDLLNWDGAPMFAYIFRRDPVRSDHGYLAGLNTARDASPAKSSLWTREQSADFLGNHRVFLMDRLIPKRGCRLVLLAVEDEMLLQVFELEEDTAEPIGALLESDSTFTEGEIELYFDLARGGTRFTVDNFSLTGVYGTPAK